MTDLGNFVTAGLGGAPSIAAPADLEANERTSQLREQIEAEINEELDDIADHNDNCAPGNAIDDFATCQRITQRLLRAFDISMRSAVSGDHSMPDDLTREYFTAARDDEGYIRLQRGKGLVVFGPDVERSRVQGWFDRSISGRFREQCRAALAVFDMESADPPIPSSGPPGAGGQ